MYIYCVTMNVDESIHQDWLEWIKTHIHEVLSTGRFIKAKMTKVLVEEKMGGITYSLQYIAKSREDLELYYQNNLEQIGTKAAQKYADKMLQFSTELQLIEDIYPSTITN